MERSSVTILVTGFGPFGDQPVNPSYLIATTLPALIPATASCLVPVRISLYPYQIPVSYDEVRALTPRLHAAYEGRVDIILHMGVSGRNYYSIERQGHRDNYDAFADIDGITLDKRDGLNFWADCPPILETSLDFDDVFQRWRSNLLDAPDVSPELFDGLVLRPSHDPGHFLCDFLYYSSLAEHWRKKKDRGGDRIDERPVMFLHVPRWIKADNWKQGRWVTIGLLRALAQSWMLRKSGGVVAN